MASLASINIRFAVDLREFSTEMQNSLRTIDKVGQKFQAVGRNMSAYVTLPILAAGAAAVKFASDYNESLNKVDVSFKSSSVEVKAFAKTSLESFGIAEGTALDMAAAYGDMGTSMGLPTAEAAKMSTSLVGLAGDLASFKNISIDIANTAIGAIFTGETESLKKLGIVMTEVNLKQFALNSGIQKNYEQMSQAEKVQLRYNYILSVTKNSQGDFTRTQGAAANQTRIFQESLKQVGAQLGSVILPLFTKVITAVNDKIKAFSKLSETTKTTIVVVAGLVAVIGPLALAIGGVLAAIPFVVAGFAMVSAAILPVFAGIVLLMGVFLILRDNTKQASKAIIELSESQKLTQKVTDEATASIVDQKAQLENLLLTARNLNEKDSTRLKAIQAINRISPEYLGNLTLENINTDKARISLEKYNAALIAGATARAASRLLEQNQSDKIKAGFEREKALAEYNAKRETAIAKGWEAEKAFYEDNNRMLQFANDALDRKNAKYDSEAKLLTEIYNKNKQNLDLLNGDVATPDIAKPVTEKAKKAEKIFDNGTIAFYEQQISLLKTQQSEVAKTGAEYYLLGNEIAAVQEKINKISFDRIEPLDLASIIPEESIVQIAGGFDALISEMEAKVGGMKSVTDAVATNMVDFGAILSVEVEKLSENLAVGFGEAIGGLISGTASLGDVVGGMMAMIGGFMKDLGKSLIAAGIAGIAFKKLFANPYVAVAAGIALVALSSVVEAKMSKGPKMQAFANGGIVGGASFYGDKIMARVNSGELIANSEQQKRIWGAMSAGNNVNVTIGGGFEIDGTKIRLVLDRTDKRKSRTS
jgi:hypothetical protein